MLKPTMLQMAATSAVNVLGVIGAGTIVGVPALKAVLMAVIVGVATVVEGLSREFLNNKKLNNSNNSKTPS
jgi:hypothetical protein